MSRYGNVVCAEAAPPAPARVVDTPEQIAVTIPASVFWRLHREYLATPEWKALRDAVLARDGTCRGCGEHAEIVHHLTYARWQCEALTDLVALCPACHDRVHERHTPEAGAQNLETEIAGVEDAIEQYLAQTPGSTYAMIRAAVPARTMVLQAALDRRARLGWLGKIKDVWFACGFAPEVVVDFTPEKLMSAAALVHLRAVEDGIRGRIASGTSNEADAKFLARRRMIERIAREGVSP